MAQGPGNRDETRPKTPAGGSPLGDSGKAPAGSYGLVGIGMEFLATICVGGAIGWYLDRRMNTFPWLMLCGAGVGLAAGLVMMIRAGRRAFKD
jgi:F0F1-type ATP synthase assembly protein I